MSDVRITCITKSHTNGGHEHITHVGNPAAGWNLAVDKVVELIENRTYTFYVQDDRTGKRANVGVVREPGKRPYLRTNADGFWNDNLLSLGTCPWRAAA